MSTANSIFSREFFKTVGGYLATACAAGKAVTRPDLAKVIRKHYGRTLDGNDLNVWLSASVNLGLFNTNDAKFITKRGVGGGIVMKGAAARAVKAATTPAVKATVKKTARKATAVPVTEPTVSTVQA